MARNRGKRRRRSQLDASAGFEPIDATPERIAKAVEHVGGDLVRHHELVDAEIERAGERAMLTRRFVDSAIDRMRKRGQLTYAQWFAADWYRTVHAQAMGEPRVVSRYGEGSGGGGSCSYGLARSEAQQNARITLRKARAVIPAKMLGLVDRVVVEDDMPALANGQQRGRFAARLAAALQPLAEWMHAPGSQGD